MAKVVSLDNLLASMAARRSEAAPWLGELIDQAQKNSPQRLAESPRRSLALFRSRQGAARDA